MSRTNWWCVAIGIVAWYLSAPAASAALVPYVENFDDDVLGTSAPAEGGAENGIFLPQGPSHVSGVSAWEVVAGSDYAGDQEYQVTNTRNGSNNNANSALDFAGSIGNGLTSSYTVSVDFRLLASNNNNSTIGLVLFGDSPVFNDGYLADISIGGTLRLFNLSAGSAITSTPTAALATDKLYRLRTSAEYDLGAGVMRLALELDNLTDNTSFATGIPSIPLAAVKTGTFVGFRTRTLNTNGSLIVAFDNFSVVPEAGAMSLVAVAATLAFAARRRLGR